MVSHMGPQRTWLVRILWILGIGIGTNAVLGPMGMRVIDYRFSETLIDQGIGLDVVALFGVVPVAFAAALLTRRDHAAGPVLAFVPTTFGAYMLPQYVVGPEYLSLPGNNEQFFLFHLALFVVAVAGLLLAWNSIDSQRLRPSSAASDLRRSWVMFGVAAFIGLGRWLPGLVELTAGDPALADFVENPTSYLLIGLLDLGLVAPAAIAAGVALRLHATWARKAAYAVIGWFAMVPASVASMAIVMVVRDDPAASTSLAGFFTVAALVFLLGAIALYRPMFWRPAKVQRAGERRPDVAEPVR